MKKLNMSFVFILFLTTLAFSQIKQSAKAPPIKIKSTKQLPELYNFRKAVEDYGIAKSYNGFDSTLAYQFQYILDSVLVANNIIGASVAISMPEKGIWLGVSGLSDPETGDSVRHDMLFDIGSNTKTFVATLILKLVDDGLITLEDQLHQWLPAFPNIDSTITIRQILNHTSGVSDFLNENPAAVDTMFSYPDRYWSPEYSLSYVLKPNFPKGTSWSYSNTGYILAGMIIKEVTGSDKVAPILRNRILDPLNLNSTFLDIEETLIGDLAHGWMYISDTNEWIDFSEIPRTAFYSAVWTAGAMVSTAEDMVKWVRSLYSGQVLSQASLNEMFSIVPFDNPIILGYGLGTMKWIWLGEQSWAHGGDTFNYGSQAAYFPGRDVAIVVMLNQRNYPYKDFYNMITELLFKEVLNYYLYPHDKVYPKYAWLNTHYFSPNQDSVKLSVHVNNPEDHTVLAFSKIINTDATYQDSIALYDDGLHGDSLAGDMIFGGAFTPLHMEDNFTLSLRTLDLDSNYEHIMENANRFTTIGPVVMDSSTIWSSDPFPNPGDRIDFLFTLTNKGLNATARNVTTTLINLDTCTSIIGTATMKYGDIAPGESSTGIGGHLVYFRSNSPDSTYGWFRLDIASNGYTFWSDSFKVFVYPTSVREMDGKQKIPAEFVLYQNYPNPFNPKTTISYQLPVNSKVELSIYNINGQKVATLVSQQQKAGYYQYEWNAIDLADGVYLYRLTTNDFVQIKKLIILK